MAASPKIYSEEILKTAVTWKEIFRSPWCIPLTLVFISIILFSCRMLAVYDIGFHLRGGQWILQNHAFPDKDVYTYTVSQNDYIDLHWLYQVLIYAVHETTGFEGISILNSCLIAGMFLLMLKFMMIRGMPCGWYAVTLLTANVVMEIRYNARPEVFSWIFVFLFLLFLDRYRLQQTKHLYLLPLGMVLWVNTQGLFVLGLGITGAYCISAWIHDKRPDRYLTKWFLVSILATLVNPYFLKGAAFPFYLFTRLESGNIFRNAISEFVSPWSQRIWSNSGLYPPAVIYLYYGLSVLCLLSFILTYKKRAVHEWLILGGFFYLSYTQFRNIPIFVIYAAPVTFLCVAEIAETIQRKLISLEPFRKYAMYGIAAAAIGTGLRTATDAYYVSDDRSVRFGWGLDQSYYPVQAAEFLNANHLDGTILNNMSVGSWLVWAIPQPVFIDGRLEVMQETFFKEYLQSFSKNGIRGLIRTYHPQLIVFEYASAMIWNTDLRAMPEWRLIYWDENSAAYAHSGYAPEIHPMEAAAVLAKSGFAADIPEEEKWKILRTRPGTVWAHWLSGFYKRQKYPKETVNRAHFASANSAWPAAERFYLEFIKQTEANFPQVYYNLGVVYQNMNAWDKSVHCYRRYLEYDPHDAYVARLIRSAESKMNGGRGEN